MQNAAQPPAKGSFSLWSKIKGHLEICRFDHWVKNIFVFPGVLIALPFAPPTTGAELAWHLVVGLLATGLVASSNYVINEVLDAPFDRMHPRKCVRPVASGRVYVPLAYVQWIGLMVLGIALALSLSCAFAIVLGVLWVMGCAYNIPPLRTKDVPYLDVLSESVNNPLRMLAGWYIVNPPFFPSTNLLLSYWMLGGYLMVLKRYAEFRDIGDHAVAGNYRKSFKYYTEQKLLVSTMFYAASSMLFLGAFIIRYKIEMIFAFPFIAWVMAIYMQLAFKKESAVQAPEKLYREPLLMTAVAICSVVLVGLFFIQIPAVSTFFAPTMQPPP